MFTHLHVLTRGNPLEFNLSKAVIKLAAGRVRPIGGLGIDVHQEFYGVVMQERGNNPKPAQRFKREAFVSSATKLKQARGAGMSTGLETIQARSRGLEVAGFSCLTNFAAGIARGKLTDNEVLVTGKQAAAAFARLLEAGFSD